MHEEIVLVQMDWVRGLLLGIKLPLAFGYPTLWLKTRTAFMCRLHNGSLLNPSVSRSRQIVAGEISKFICAIIHLLGFS